MCFTIKIAMFRYTPISGKKKPHQQLVAYISHRVPIISDTVLHPMSFLGNQTQVYPPSHIAIRSP